MQNVKEPICLEEYPGLRLRWNILQVIVYCAVLALFYLVIYLMDRGFLPVAVREFLFSPLEICGWCRSRYEVVQNFDGQSGDVYALLFIPSLVCSVIGGLGFFVLYKTVERRAFKDNPSRRLGERGARWQAICRMALFMAAVYLLSPLELIPGRIGFAFLLVTPTYPLFLCLIVVLIGADIGKISGWYLMRRAGGGATS